MIYARPMLAAQLPEAWRRPQEAKEIIDKGIAEYQKKKGDEMKRTVDRAAHLIAKVQ